MEAQLIVAKIYNIGEVEVEISQANAEKWYRIAAKAGSRVAQNQVAWWLRMGDEASIEELEESKRWSLMCLELRPEETHIPDEPMYLHHIKQVDLLIREAEVKAEAEKIRSIVEGPKRVGLDEFLIQATTLFNQASDGVDPESSMLVGMVYGMTGMSSKSKEWFDEMMKQRGDAFPIPPTHIPKTKQPEAGKSTRPRGTGIRMGEMEKDAFVQPPHEEKKTCSVKKTDQKESPDEKTCGVIPFTNMNNTEDDLDYTRRIKAISGSDSQFERRGPKEKEWKEEKAFILTPDDKSEDEDFVDIASGLDDIP